MEERREVPEMATRLHFIVLKEEREKGRRRRRRRRRRRGGGRIKRMR